MILKTYGPTLWITQKYRIMKAAARPNFSSGAREDGPATKSLPYLIDPPSHIIGATGWLGKDK